MPRWLGGSMVNGNGDGAMRDRPRATWQDLNSSTDRIGLSSENSCAQLALYDFQLDRSSRRRVLVLKLDHRGDFLIGLPALEMLRATFADDHITLVCGSWNAATAR